MQTAKQYPEDAAVRKNQMSKKDEDCSVPEADSELATWAEPLFLSFQHF